MYRHIGAIFGFALTLTLFGLAFAETPSVTAEDVTFRSAGVVLSGTVVTPREIITAAVVVHGSGQEKSKP
jgi:hypothetical protein